MTATSEHRFATIEEAIAAGYRRCPRHEDVTPPGPGEAMSFGYGYRGADGVESVRVTLTDTPNRTGVCPSFLEMYPPTGEAPQMTATTRPGSGQTQTLRYYGPDEVPQSPGWTVVTYDADGVMVAEDIISDERAAELRASGVKDER